MSTNDPDSLFAKRVRDRREHLKSRGLSGWTVRAVAERLGVKHTYLVALEGGRTAPSDRMIEGLSRELGLDRDELHALAGTIPPDVRCAVASNVRLFRLVRAMADADEEQVDGVVRSIREGEW